MTAWNLVISYGDLSRQTGYRTRVVGELEHLDRQAGLDPFLLLFDRDPATFERTFTSNVPFRVQPRASMIRFYPEVARLARQAPIRTVHAHNLYSAALALSARRIHGYRVVLDYHGRIPEEYVYLGKGGEPSRKALEQLERWTIKHSDHIIVVSGKLRDYLAERYATPTSKLSVIPCCADGNSFRWDIEKRRQTRRELGLDGRFVCTHLGSFFEWYDHELLLHLFDRIRSLNPAAHLLVASSESEKVRDYLKDRLPVEAFTVITASHDRVPSVLNASDLGLLLLRPSPNIETSSPAKFSEYLNCGLPVLITENVGDFSSLVRSSGAGAVVDARVPLDAGMIQDLAANREAYAAKSAAIGRQLQWEAYGALMGTILN